MSGRMPPLAELAARLAAHPCVREKAVIHDVWSRAIPSAAGIPLGDDCAALRQPDGSHLLFAAEGIQADFLAMDPWFAGYSAVMVNLSDVAAMGGKPIALTDVITSVSAAEAEPVWQGMEAASLAYGVPIVGGHTSQQGRLSLAVSVLGAAGPRLLTSFHAEPGDELILCMDLNGDWRRDFPFWNASTDSPPKCLQDQLAIFPELARKGWCRSAKDISNGGIPGTLAMLCTCSRVGAILDLDAIPMPPDTSIERWLTTFPSYGYIMAVKPAHTALVCERFEVSNIASACVGAVTSNPDIVFCTRGESANFSAALRQPASFQMVHS